MSIRATLGTTLIGIGRKIGRAGGETELAVTLSEHSIDVRMIDIDSLEHVWNPNLYRHGNVFLQGYANPIKPTTEDNEEHDHVKDASLTDEENFEKPEDSHTKLIRTGEYREYVKQVLLESVLNPSEKWRIIIYAIIAIALLQVMTLMSALAAAGLF